MGRWLGRAGVACGFGEALFFPPHKRDSGSESYPPIGPEPRGRLMQEYMGTKCNGTLGALGNKSQLPCKGHWEYSRALWQCWTGRPRLEERLEVQSIPSGPED